MAAALRSGLLLSLCLMATGCQHFRPLWSKEEARPTGTVVQIAAAWEGCVRFTHDLENGGATLPGIAGRLYLFGEKIDHPLVGEGMLVVDFYDDRPLDVGQIPKRIYQYQIDKERLAKLLRKDTIGWGYTVFLPWPDYQTDITKVHMFVRYIPDRGAPLYATSHSITLSDVNRPNFAVASRTVIPNLAQQPQQVQQLPQQINPGQGGATQR